jgi:transcriptional regulator with XRE-family HTH domain
MAQSVIAMRLKQARMALGVSQRELGIRAGIDEFVASARINQYERGKHVPDFSTLERLAQVLGVAAPFFYTRDDMLAEMIQYLGKLSPTALQEVRRCIEQHS